jgi:hypothetical protein
LPASSVSPQELRLTSQEQSIINAIVGTDEFDISPRLLKRFLSIWLIARHLWLLRNRLDGLPAKAPDPSFVKWLALSVRFPFETTALLKWLDYKEWADPFGSGADPDDTVFHKEGRFVLLEPREKMKETDWSIGKAEPKLSSAFAGLSVPELSNLGKLLVKWKVDLNVVKETRRISDCFNLVLD